MSPRRWASLVRTMVVEQRPPYAALASGLVRAATGTRLLIGPTSVQAFGVMFDDFTADSSVLLSQSRGAGWLREADGPIEQVSFV